MNENENVLNHLTIDQALPNANKDDSTSISDSLLLQQQQKGKKLSKAEKKQKKHEKFVQKRKSKRQQKIAHKQQVQQQKQQSQLNLSQGACQQEAASSSQEQIQFQQQELQQPLQPQKTRFTIPYRERMKDSKIEIVIDCAFQTQQTAKELGSLTQQLMYCQNINKQSAAPVRFSLSDFTGEIKKRLISNSVQNWGVGLYENGFLDHCVAKEKVVYLTGDAEEDMQDVEPDSMYVIGGMVDHNRIKRGTYDKAKSMGLRMLRFPIQQHLQLRASSILAVNHVFHILVLRANGKTWNEAFQIAIPKRKIALIHHT